MSREPKEIQNELLKSGSVTIKNILCLKETKNGICVRVDKETPKHGYTIPRITTLKETPGISEIETYIDSVNTILEWKEHRYQNVNGWTYNKKKRANDWRTPEDNYVRIIPSKSSRLKFSTGRYSKQLLGDFSNISKTHLNVKASAAIFLNSTDPKMFDYQKAKYESIRDNLTDIHGIGNTVSRELINKGCTTYQEAKGNLWRTDLPSMYVNEAESELQKQIDAGAQLIDPELKQEYSDILLATNI